MPNDRCVPRPIHPPILPEITDLEELWHLFLTATGGLAILAVVVLVVLFLEGIL